MFTAQFAFTKIYGEKVDQQINETLIMVIITSLIGSLIFFTVGGLKVTLSPELLILATAFALVMIPYYVLGVKVLSMGSVGVYSMFMMLGGMLLPFLYGILFLEEPLTVGKLAGTLLLSLSIILQTLTQKNEKAKNKKLFFLLCIAIFVLNGLTGVIAKAYQVTSKTPDEVSFTAVSCFLTALILIIFYLIPSLFKNQNMIKAEIKNAFVPSVFLSMAAIGIAAHTGNFLHLKVASSIPASVQFPMVSGGVIVFSAIVSAKIFKEKISRAELICITGAFISTLLFAF